MSVIELLNYLVEWGRLCIPNPSDSNNRRWKETQLWENIKALVAEFSLGVDWPTSRYPKEFKGISPGYLNHLSGTISGGMARLGQDNPNMVSLIKGLEKNGHSLDSIQRKAKVKANIYSKL